MLSGEISPENQALKVAIHDDPIFREHDSGAGHPERPQRVDAVRRGIEDAGLAGRLSWPAVRAATDAELLRVHTDKHVRAVAATDGRTVAFDPDTLAGPRTYAAALHAAGAVVDAVTGVLDGQQDRAFCLSRPPGHHAESERVMGFCYFNNVAVAAAEALARGVARVLIVDFDVHHGNGTQEIFYPDPRVLYVSSHQFPFYPGTGMQLEQGAGPGRGFTVNLPMPAGSDDADYLRVYREIVLPLARAFDPELVLASAGFDAFGGDPLAGMRLTADGYGALAGVCLEAAAGAASGRAVFALEGGYDLEGLASSGAAVTRVLLGQAAPDPGGTASAEIERRLPLYRAALSPFWSVLA
jgi:acetoin utilization deacetylase AcuC-like enzyme